MNRIVSATLACLLIGQTSSTQTSAHLDWSMIHDGDGHGVDLPNASTMDHAGNLYTTGRSSGIGSGQDYLTIKYSPSGQQLAAIRYNGPASSWDEATGIAVDRDGNMYVTGLSFYSSSGQSIVTVKYADDGTTRWLSKYPSDNSFSASAIAIALDANDGVYVAGSPALTLIKYSSQGTQLWERTFQRETSMVNTARALVVSPQGDVYVTGQVSEECPEGICRYDMVTLKYNEAGELRWVRYYTRSGNSDEQPAAMTLDSSGNILVTAVCVDTSGENILVMKYSPLGTLEWAVVYDGMSSSYDNPSAIAVDRNDNVIVAGTSWNNAEEFNYCAFKYSPSGQRLWSAEYNRAYITRDFASGLAVDSHGDIYITGGSRFGYLGKDTCTTIKLNAQGELVWSAAYSRPDTGIDWGEHVFVDSAANVYVTGSSVARNGWDYFAIKYRQTTVGVEEEPGRHPPLSHALRQNYPNPFNPSTNVEFRVKNVAFVSLKVYDLLGREVATLVNEVKQPGGYEVSWNATGLSSGVYVIRLQAGSYTESKKMMVVR